MGLVTYVIIGKTHGNVFIAIDYLLQTPCSLNSRHTIYALIHLTKII